MNLQTLLSIGIVARWPRNASSLRNGRRITGESVRSHGARRVVASWMRNVPDAAAALTSYRELAPHYDDVCVRIAAVRECALGILDARPGETIVDVACGSGAMLPGLAARVGSGGRVIGIEQSPEMIALARHRFAGGQLPAQVDLLAAPAECAELSAPVDAYLFSYAHDVLQSPAALRNVLGAGTPGARVVVCGMRLLPWWYAAPINLWCTWGARHYVSTFRGLRRPWSALRERCADFALVRTFYAGTSFVAVGHLTTAEPCP